MKHPGHMYGGFVPAILEWGTIEHRLTSPPTSSTTDNDDGNDGEASGFSVRCSSAIAHSDKPQARPPTDNFKRLMEETYPNQAYLVKHKLNDCCMMRSFMTLGSLTWGVELDEGLNGSDMMHFPRENIVLRVY
jgi:hypothetical protein